mgnify:CR=1 FL=1
MRGRFLRRRRKLPPGLRARPNRTAPACCCSRINRCAAGPNLPEAAAADAAVMAGLWLGEALLHTVPEIQRVIAGCSPVALESLARLMGVTDVEASRVICASMRGSPQSTEVPGGEPPALCDVAPACALSWCGVEAAGSFWLSGFCCSFAGEDGLLLEAAGAWALLQHPMVCNNRHGPTGLFSCQLGYPQT